MNAGDADTALNLFAEDAIRLDSATPELARVGKAQIEPGLRARVADHIRVETSDYQSDGNHARCIASVFTDYGRQLGFAPVVEIAEVVVVANKIQRFTVTVMPESLERIRVAELRRRDTD